MTLEIASRGHRGVACIAAECHSRLKIDSPQSPLLSAARSRVLGSGGQTQAIRDLAKQNAHRQTLVTFGGLTTWDAAWAAEKLPCFPPRDA